MLRATPTGRKTYAFEGRLNGATVRISIGTAADWTLEAARRRAAELKQTMDAGQDPRQVERQKVAAAEAKRIAEAVQAEADLLADVTLGDAWAEYVADRREHWGERHYADHLKMVKAGGERAKRGVRLLESGERPRTVAGPLFPLLDVRLRELTSDRVERWAAEQAKNRPTYARLCWRCLKVFLNWCAEHARYSRLLPTVNPAKTKKAREILGRTAVKDDALQREQLPAWFAAVRSIQNPVISAYLQAMLLTGARPGELLRLRWDDLNTQWKTMVIRDKVEGERVIPLTPYVARMLSELPHRNEWVFSSTRSLSLDPAIIKRREAKHARKGTAAPTGEQVQASTSGHLTDPSSAHRSACAAAGLDGLTLHGLRRSFSTLSEWLEMPVGVVAQIQGHKPSAIAEKHYKRRPIDLLRMYHERLESWILQQAGVPWNALEPGTPVLKANAPAVAHDGDFSQAASSMGEAFAKIDIQTRHVEKKEASPVQATDATQRPRPQGMGAVMARGVPDLVYRSPAQRQKTTDADTSKIE